MFSKSFIVCLVSSIFVLGCQEERVDLHQTMVPEGKTFQEGVELKSKDWQNTNRYGEDYLQILNIIDQGELPALLQAKKMIEERLYNEKTNSVEYYSSPRFGGYLELNSVLVERLKVLADKDSAEAEKAIESTMQKYSQVFINPCVGSNQTCDLFGVAIKNESSSSAMIYMLAENEIDELKRINLLGAVFDVSNRRKRPKTEDLYLRTVLSVLSKEEAGNLELEPSFTKKHLTNVLNIAQGVEWEDPTEDNVARYEFIQAWNFRNSSEKSLNELRQLLVRYLPIYGRRSAQVRAGIREVVKEKIAEVQAGKANLLEYPAFDDIDLNQFMNGDVVASYLVFQTYFQELPIQEANQFFANVRNQPAFVDRFFEITKALVKWDIAQLSIESTVKLENKFSEQETKTNAFFQEVLDWSKNLIPVWTEFHSVRLNAVKSFLNSNILVSQTVDERESREFFSSVNSNIYKTAVYPNMMAFAYYMSKTEWQAILRILWFQFKLDTALIMDYMVTGNYQNPWFNFTNLSEEKGGWGMASKKSLFRSEMQDAFYYFIMTKTHETYGIDADDFLKTVFENVLKRRLELFEKTYSVQRSIYFLGNKDADYYYKWCQGIKNNDFIEESIEFYESNKAITPIFVNSDTSGEFNRKPPLYFADEYKQVGSYTDGQTSTNDRLRTELGPIERTMKRYQATAKRIRQNNPSLKLKRFTESEKLVNYIESVRMRYQGIQYALATKFDECSFIGHEEGKRRVKSAGFAHYTYYKDFIYPLLAGVAEGRLSVDDANSIIQEFHENHPGIEDRVVVSKAGHPMFVASKLSFMVRTQMFLTRGRSFEGPEGIQIEIPAVVGSHLKIPIPSSFLEDPKNPYKIGSGGDEPYISANYTDRQEDFALQLLIRGTDRSRGPGFAGRWTSWDQQDLVQFSRVFPDQVMFYANMYQMGKQEIVDPNLPGCLKSLEEDVDPECVKEIEFTREDVESVSLRILDTYRLYGNDFEYFRLTNTTGWVGQFELNTILEYDSATPLNYFTEALPYQRIRGIFDLGYRMLDADFLGKPFLTLWEIEEMRMADRPASVSCQADRIGCYWQSERVRATEFFFARTKRPRPFFKYDHQIVGNEFEQVKEQVLGKYERLLDYESKVPGTLDQWFEGREDERMIYVNVYKKPTRAKALTPSLLQAERQYEKYFVEKTEGFFLKDHNWQDYQIQ